LAAIFGILLIVAFCIQQYLLMYEYIPAVLNIYEDIPKVYEHVKNALYTIVKWMLVWPLIVLGLIVGLLMRKSPSRGS